ncbi:hypothetical protein KHA76_001806 [Salmonella enterica subsp. houtenae serovar 44:z36,[z38]:-]|uniref:DUF4760 domain-containing protein n=1 Tax=Salmonella enterica subsp. houtenae serovar 44:z36[z38]:- TaxID=1967609 RepID=A0A736HZA1_SALHO|nr:hypothetical protein [Salmonella enterica]EHM8757115.1 hypothetical protein [Salmonella enterica subsp. houtenae serovar 44:z36,[z38]:-]HAE7580908.1 hypothetical protein [Salmonella enterica subsp. houtenae serovar 44:z36[z38]:-]HCM6266702.1 hypothetical protein [Salmonella enterica subsp. houtenae serovar 44:z36,Z38:-]EGF3877529.1 hypothetical protein [Salmonella enterica]
MSAVDWVDIGSKVSVGLITGLVTGLIVAYCTAQYALNRFYKEKWWEKRLTAFLELTEYVYKVKRADDYWVAVMESKMFEDESFISLPEEEIKKLREEQSLAMKEIIRISHLASFTLSHKASELLTTYITEYDKIYPSWWVDEITDDEATIKSSEIIDALFNELLTEARTVLNIPEEKINLI